MVKEQELVVTLKVKTIEPVLDEIGEPVKEWCFNCRQDSVVRFVCFLTSSLSPELESSMPFKQCVLCQETKYGENVLGLGE